MHLPAAKAQGAHGHAVPISTWGAGLTLPFSVCALGSAARGCKQLVYLLPPVICFYFHWLPEHKQNTKNEKKKVKFIQNKQSEVFLKMTWSPRRMAFLSFAPQSKWHDLYLLFHFQSTYCRCAEYIIAKRKIKYHWPCWHPCPSQRNSAVWT